jgi:Type II CAAX prenyl endopeptidase Rce1-like
MEPQSPHLPPADPVAAPERGAGAGSIATAVEPTAPGAGLPDRYLLREDDRGRYLSCVDLPEVKVRIERGQTATAAAARKAAEGTIFLDGAAQGEPFLDLERRVYNLDHHEGCVRSFTLATCEQALVLVLRGFDLREKPWTLRANDPDLDTLLAVWVLLNASHLRDDAAEARRAALQLVRLEGVIDVHGLERQDLTAFPAELLSETWRRLEGLRERELAVKRSGQWGVIDPLEYTAPQLAAIDRLVYPPGHFEGFRGFEELATVELGRDRVAVVCRAESGIYEIERELKRLYGRRLGVIVLQKDPATYTLRQVDPFLPAGLEAVYEKLNVLDPAVSRGSHNRWGGSDEIGGSPRKSGTELSPPEIADAFRLAYRPPGSVARLSAAATAMGLSAVPMAVAWWGTVRRGVEAGEGEIDPVFVAAGLGVAMALLVGLARKRPRLFGVHLPRGWDWLVLLPAALAGALFGGAWIATPPGGARAGLAGLLRAGPGPLLALFALPLLAEVTFRGLALGILVRRFRVQHPGGRWFISGPAVLCSLLYAVWTVPVWLLAGAPAARWWPALAPGPSPLAIGGLVLGAGLFGLAAAIARERSASLVAPTLFHYLALAAVVAAAATR